MREPLSQFQQPRAVSVSMPAPVGGWNTIDPVADMPQKDAIFLDNIFPRTSDVMLRRGFSEWAKGPVGATKLMVYEAPTGVSKMFVTAPDGIYSAVLGQTSATLESGYSSAQHDWYSLNISTAGGNFLWCCNGSDNARYFDGTDWTVLTDTSSPALTGLPTDTIAHVSMFKERLMFCENQSLSFWYLDPNSIAGTATEYPLGSLFRLGGYLVATTSWTIDAGSGSDDYFVAITSKGECAVFQGVDPSSASSWSLVGIYMLAAPLGRDCFIRMGGDVAVITVQGVMPLSKALMTATIDRNSNLTRKVDRALLDAAELYKNIRGWQGTLYPEASMLILNVPGYQGYAEQYVMNTMTGAWCRFKGMQARSWATMNGQLFFTDGTDIHKAWDGDSDNGESIEARVKTAFMYFRSRNTTKKISMIRPVFQINQDISYQLHVDVDYEDDYFAYSQGVSTLQQLAIWDEAIWDEAYWLAEVTQARWRSVSQRPGRALALNLRLNPKGVSMNWSATDFLLVRGGLL